MPMPVRFLVMFILLSLAACGQGEQAASLQEASSVSVGTLRLTPTEARECRSLPGEVASRNSVTLSSKLSGTVVEVMAAEGDMVAKGQPILRIDDTELRLREQSTQSAAGQASLERQALAARTSQAKATYQRMNRLLAEGVLSQDEVDRARAEYEALLSQTRAVAAQTSSVGFQKQEIRTLRGYSVVTAPIAGVLTRRFADLGAFVNAGQPLAAIDESGQGYEIVSLADESLLGHVAQGMRVVAMVPSLSREPFLTVLTSVIERVDPTNRAFRVKAALGAQSGSPSAGLYGKICVPVKAGAKLLVPAEALRKRGDLVTAFIVDGQGILRLRLVKTGARYQQATFDGQTFILETATDAPEGAREMVEVLAGLNKGEELAVDVPDTAREGDRVERKG